MAKVLRVGIIGANWGLISHLPAWRSLPGIEVAAICTAHRETAERAAREYDIPRAYWDFYEMMRDPDIDIVDVGTRPSLRYDMVMAALAAGKHVYNANPFAMNMAQASDMLAEQTRRGVVGQVDAQFQWVPQIARMKELIDEGFLGDLYSVSVNCHYPLLAGADYHYPFVAHTGVGQPYSWLADATSGASVLRNLGGHCLHGLIFLFGEIGEVSACLDTFLKEWRFPDQSTLAPKTADTAQVLLKFKGGGMGHLNVSWVVADAAGFSIEAYGSKGRLRLQASTGFPDTLTTRLYGAPCAPQYTGSMQEAQLTIPERLLSLPGVAVSPNDPRPTIIPMLKMFDSLVRAIRTGSAARPDFAQACHVQAVVEAAERAHAERCWVDL